MRRAWAVAGALVLFVALGHAAPAQVTIPTSSTTTSAPKPTTTTTHPPASSSTTAAPGATTTAPPKKPSTTAAPTTTAKPTTTIPTPPPAPTTTAAPVPVSRHSGHFSPAFSILAVLGLMAGIGLLLLQWFLTKPGREGWTL